MVRRVLQTLVLSGLLLCLSVLLSVYAQQLDCSDAIKTAMKQVGDKCGNIGRNKACYGSGSVIATPNDGVQPQDFVFHAPGDKVDVNKLKSLQLAALDPSGQQFGVAYLEIQANLGDGDPSKYVTLILSGDTRLQNVSTAPSQPFQAVVIETGVQSPACHKAPTSGLLIQTRPGTGPVSLTVNGVQLGVSSTVFIQQPSSNLSGTPSAVSATLTPVSGTAHTLKISTLQGHVMVTANGHTKTVATNQQTDITLDDQGDQPSDNGDPIGDVTEIDSQDNPEWAVADGVDDSLIEALPTDESAITDTPDVSEAPETTDTPEITETPEASDVPEITDTPETGNASSENGAASEVAPTPEGSQSDNSQSAPDQPTDAPSSLRPGIQFAFAPLFR